MDRKSGKDALAAALARASRHPGVAVLAAALVPLATAAVPAHASSTGTSPFDVVSHVYASSGGAPTLFTYAVTNNSTLGLRELLIPELNAGDFLLPSGPAAAFNYAPVLPIGWSVVQISNSTGSGGGPTLKNGATTPDMLAISDYGNNGGLAQGNTATFQFYSDFSGTVLANVEAYFTDGSSATFDPPVPNSAVPEPVTTALLASGLLGLAAARSRKKG